MRPSVRRVARRLTAIGVALLTVAGCSTGGAGDDSALATTTTAPAPDLEETIADLWTDYEVAVVTSSPEGFEQVLAEPALTMRGWYWLDYCPGYCGALPEASAVSPDVDVLATSADGSSAVALVTTSSRWPTGRTNDIAVIVRVDGGPDGWRMTFMDERTADDSLPNVPAGELGPLHDRGQELASEYLELVDAMETTGQYPEDPAFADGLFTDQLLDAMATWREPEPWEDRTLDRQLAPENDSVGFTVASDNGERLHCALFSWTETVQHVSGKPIGTLPVLGDLAHMVEDGTYSSFTIDGYDAVCIVERPGELPQVLTYDMARTGVEGTEVGAT